MAEQLSLQHERVDDIPLLVGLMQRLRFPPLLDRFLGNHGLHQGYSNGWLATIWLAYILSAGDHRKAPVQEWSQRHRITLERLTGMPLRDVEFSDDRLGILLHRFADTSAWEALEEALWAVTAELYRVEITGIRLDSTTSYGYHTPVPGGLMQIGQSKDHRPDLAQLKVMAAGLEGTGHWVACNVLSGQSADDPLYTPLIARVRQVLGRCGILYTGDSKMAALETRARVVMGRDDYLTILPRTGTTPPERARWVDAVVAGEQPVALLWDEPPHAASPRRLLGYGYEFERTLAVTVDGEAVTWRERVQVVRSLDLVKQQEATLEKRLAEAEAALRALTPPPKRGQHQFREEAALQQAVEGVLTRQRVTGLLTVAWEREETATTRGVGRGRGGPNRPTHTLVKVRYVITAVERQAAAIAQEQYRLGWRIQVTSAAEAQLSLGASVRHYRDGPFMERGFHLIKDKPIGIQPLYVQSEDQIVGLTRLLSLGLRLLTAMERQVRRSLAAAGEALAGLVPGQPRQETAAPTALRLLQAFAAAEITLTRIEMGHQAHWHLTPLPALLTRVLEHLGLSVSLYTRLAENST